MGVGRGVILQLVGIPSVERSGIRLTDLFTASHRGPKRGRSSTDSYRHGHPCLHPELWCVNWHHYK
jgi:hypothetical protein